MWNSWSSCLYFPSARIVDVYRHAWFYMALGIEPKALCILNKHSTGRAVCAPIPDFSISTNIQSCDLTFFPQLSHLKKMEMVVGPTHMVAKVEDWPDLL